MRPFEVDPNPPTLAAAAIPGSWTIERWAESGSATTGSLVIDEGGHERHLAFPLADGQIFEEAVGGVTANVVLRKTS